MFNIDEFHKFIDIPFEIKKMYPELFTVAINKDIKQGDIIYYFKNEKNPLTPIRVTIDNGVIYPTPFDKECLKIIDFFYKEKIKHE